MIDWEKPVQTKNGRAVVVCRYGVPDRSFSIMGYIKQSSCDQWEPASWDVHGQTSRPDQGFSLVNVPEKFDFDVFIHELIKANGNGLAFEHILKCLTAKIMEQIEAKNP